MKFSLKQIVFLLQKWYANKQIFSISVSVSVSDHCVSNPGRDIAVMWAKLTGDVNIS